jgi:hypothetical protein
MKLPNPERAVIDIMKLRDYCLNPHHPRGRHKARVFAAALGLKIVDADFLRSALSRAALNSRAIPTEKDDYGQRYVLDFPMTGPKGQAIVRSSWIVLKRENFARFLSCYVL